MGGFDRRFSTSADFDFAVRLHLAGRVDTVTQPLVLYRMHSDNMHRGIATMEHDMVDVMDKVFDGGPTAEVSRDAAMARLFNVLAGSYWEVGAAREAIRCAVRSVGHDPRVIRSLFRAGLRVAFRGATRRRLPSGT